MWPDVLLFVLIDFRRMGAFWGLPDHLSIFCSVPINKNKDETAAFDEVARLFFSLFDLFAEGQVPFKQSRLVLIVICRLHVDMHKTT